MEILFYTCYDFIFEKLRKFTKTVQYLNVLRRNMFLRRIFSAKKE